MLFSVTVIVVTVRKVMILVFSLNGAVSFL